MRYYYMAEMIELPNDEYMFIDTGTSWEVNTITGRNTEHTKEVPMRIPKNYIEGLVNYLHKKGYKIDIEQQLWTNRTDQTITVELKTKQGKNRERLVTILYDTIDSYFENGRLL